MNCRFCGTALPDGAAYCGECGRAVAVASPRRRASVPEVALGGSSTSPIAVAVDDTPSRFEPAPRVPAIDPASLAPEPSVPERAFLDEPLLAAAGPVSAAEPEPDSVECPQCGRRVRASEVFCGDCGFVLSSVVRRGMPDARDTAVIAPADLDFTGIVVHTAPRDVPISAPLVGDPVPPAEPVAVAEPVVAAEPVAVAEPVVTPEPVVAAEPEAVEEPDSELEPDPVVEREPEPVAEPEPEPERVGSPVDAAQPPADEESRPARPLRSVPDPFPWGKGPGSGVVDLEKTRVVASGPAEERFVLQFSTGESVIVTGAGLVGRNPAAQPGEYVDQLVTIFDVGKSVSKTHLEFGQESGRFWVSDRYSTNGSTVRQPDLEPKRCEPGRRYFVARGTRVDIGDQFFVVS